MKIKLSQYEKSIIDSSKSYEIYSREEALHQIIRKFELIKKYVNLIHITEDQNGMPSDMNWMRELIVENSRFIIEANSMDIEHIEEPLKAYEKEWQKSQKIIS